MASGIKKTPLFEMHITRGAKMAPVSGWNLPLYYYEGVAEEQKHAREGAAVIDSCHAYKFRIAGKGAASALDVRLACPVADQAVGSVRTNYLLNDRGGVADEVLVCAMAEEDFFLIAHAGITANMLQEALPEEVAFQDLSELLGKIDLLGPAADAVLEELDVPEEDLPEEDGCKSQVVAEIPCILIRRELAGEPGYELCFAADYAEDMWEILLDTDPVLPAGQGAWDALRIEAGQPRVGSELTAVTSLIHAGLAPLLCLEEMPERRFAGKDALLNLAGPRKLMGVVLEGRRTARAGSKIMADGQEIGVVTGGAFSPVLGRAVVMGWLDEAFAAEDTKVEVLAGDVSLAGQVASLPLIAEVDEDC